MTAWHLATTLDRWRREAIAVEVAGREIALFRIGDAMYATDAICTHAYACLADGYLDGDVIECPLHGGRFHVPTGKALGDPVEVDLKTYPVRVEGGDVFVDLASEEPAMVRTADG